MKQISKCWERGFTLVEVMVALLIVAIAVSSLLFQMMSTIDNTAYLRDQTIAHWVALNQLELVYIENENTNQMIDVARTGSVQMAGRDWYWTITPIATANNRFVQLQVTVRENENDESSIVSVTGLIDNYHAL